MAKKIEKLNPQSKANQEMLTTVLAEACGNCLYCGRFLGAPVRRKIPTDNAEIVYLLMADSEEPCDY